MCTCVQTYTGGMLNKVQAQLDAALQEYGRKGGGWGGPWPRCWQWQGSLLQVRWRSMHARRGILQ